MNWLNWLGDFPLQTKVGGLGVGHGQQEGSGKFRNWHKVLNVKAAEQILIKERKNQVKESDKVSSKKKMKNIKKFKDKDKHQTWK